jgi:uncharacterized protein (TIGR02268 family)
LLASALAGVQPRPTARERQVINTRQLVLPTSTMEPVPEVRVAPGILTTRVFDAALARDSVKLDGEGTRIRVVDVGDRSVIVEPLVELGQERVLLRVRFADGAAPEGPPLPSSRTRRRSAYRRDRDHVEGEGWSGGAEECR